MRPLLATLLVLAGTAFADPGDIQGTWLSGDGDGLIAIKVSTTYLPNGKKGADPFISATILGTPNEDPDRADTDEKNPDPALRSRKLVGLEIFRGFSYDGDGRWSRGFIYDPNSGKTYRCKLNLVDRDTLEVRGFIGISLIGRTETWKRQPD